MFVGISKWQETKARMETGKFHHFVIQHSHWPCDSRALLSKYKITCGNQMVFLFRNRNENVKSFRFFAFLLRFPHNFECFCTLSLNLRTAQNQSEYMRKCEKRGRIESFLGRAKCILQPKSERSIGIRQKAEKFAVIM